MGQSRFKAVRQKVRTREEPEHLRFQEGGKTSVRARRRANKWRSVYAIVFGQSLEDDSSSAQAKRQQWRFPALRCHFPMTSLFCYGMSWWNGPTRWQKNLDMSREKYRDEKMKTVGLQRRGPRAASLPLLNNSRRESGSHLLTRYQPTRENNPTAGRKEGERI